MGEAVCIIDGSHHNAAWSFMFILGVAVSHKMFINNRVMGRSCFRESSLPSVCEANGKRKELEVGKITNSGNE